MTRKKSLHLDILLLIFDPTSFEVAVPFTVEKGHIHHQFSPACPYLSNRDTCRRIHKISIQDGRWLASYCFSAFETCPRYLGQPIKPQFRISRTPKKAKF